MKNIIIWLFILLATDSYCMNLNEQLLLACDKNDLVSVQHTLLCGADIDYQNKQGVSPLIQAADKGSSDVVRFLLNKGAKVNTTTALKHMRLPHCTALQAALANLTTQSDNLCARLLVYAGANPLIEAAISTRGLQNLSDAKNLRGPVALDMAKEKQPISIIELIKEYSRLFSETQMHPSEDTISKAIEQGCYGLVSMFLKTVPTSYEKEQEYALSAKKHYMRAMKNKDAIAMQAYSKIGSILKNRMGLVGPESRISKTGIIAEHTLSRDIVNIVRKNI